MIIKMEESSCRMDEEEEEETDFSSSYSDDAGSDVIDGAIPADRLTFHDESSSSSSSSGGGGMLIRLHEESNEYALLKHRFYLSIGSLSLSKNYTTVVVAAHRNLHYSPMKKAQLNSFRMFLKAMEDKCQGNANVMHAYWYATSKDESLKIILNGFRVSGKPEQEEEEEEDSTGSFGFGLNLYPDRSACQSLVSSPVDEDGLRHVVVCRVILGRSEVIPPGSKQCGPSCENFDSGVDNLQSPSKYIVWYPDVKTNILPLYALTVKLDNYFHSPQGLIQREPTRQPSSPWMPFTALLCRLSKFLSPSAMCLIRRSHTDFLERKISRQQFVQRVRQLTGDKLLVHAIRDFQDKRMKAIARDTT